ncbi:cobalt-precorrin-5B (C(1))-methyltransferase CbiD [Desulfonatronovibrio hydrogenovorans]|uniref:cobalt-precorrin-5B (C(1))-methyltransferase CbiD n=1 Tax=Desulfonatronovibrio hydrogenovorans TaxID=53245 RepID=UPI00054CDC63|nr:cobalt-precorrin-5B (C(1))-methyltransferase CbiD [Desulfonatronovibrio hydrogenovorans]
MNESKRLRTGISTGTCAAAAAKAAAILLMGAELGTQVEVRLPSGKGVAVRVVQAGLENGQATALVRKDAGDDPDETHGLLIGARVEPAQGGISITGGKGVGRVTKPGLAIAPGNPAINPVPLKMIKTNLALITDLGLAVEIFVPDGEKIAAKTFNERLGIIGGISILGTSGIVRPFSLEAIKETISLHINMVLESGYTRPVLVPGRIGCRTALDSGFSREEIVEVSNEWKFAFEKCHEAGIMGLVIVGHPGKLLKFINKDFQTHSKKSGSAVPVLVKAIQECLGFDPPELNTVEHGICLLSVEQRNELGRHLAEKVRQSVLPRLAPDCQVQVILNDLQGEVIGRA